jgi:hypothetical protein
MASEIQETTLYNDKFKMVHNPNARGRAPRYKVITKTGEEFRPKGVTTILGNTLSKDLVGWAVGACVDYLREKLPVITEEDLLVGAKEYERLRDAGGSTGTEAHELVETYLKGTVSENKKPSKEAQAAYNAFVEWFEKEKPTVLGVEKSIYSGEFNYCGTFDGLMKINEKVYLVDLKTTNPSRKAPNGVYAEMFMQLGAYALAYNEQREYELANGGSDLVEIEGLMVISAKKNGVLDVVTAEDLGLSVGDCGEMFKRVVNLHTFMKVITEKLGGK